MTVEAMSGEITLTPHEGEYECIFHILPLFPLIVTIHNCKSDKLSILLAHQVNLYLTNQVPSLVIP